MQASRFARWTLRAPPAEATVAMYHAGMKAPTCETLSVSFGASAEPPGLP
jgi:hypothetical protein